MAYLEIETSEGGRSLPLGGDHLTIGRLSYNDLSIPSLQISRQHAELRCVDGAWWIVDLNSTNGLHLHGERIQEHKLASGDRVVLAPSITLRYVEEASSVATPQPTPAPPPTGEAAQRRSTAQGTPKQRRTAGFTASDEVERRITNPIARPYPSSGQVYPPLVPPGPMLPEKPRSIYSDDEVPYVPSSMAPPAASPDLLSPTALDSKVGPRPSANDARGAATVPYSSRSEAASAIPGSQERDSGIPQASNNWHPAGDLYSQAPAGPQDLYRRSEPG
ncbi:MAG: hypothetical protein C5B60_09810, partial [Chloroflexi bacterium]